MSKKKVVTHKFFNTGVVVDKETGEMIEPEGEQTIITIEQLFEEPDDEESRIDVLPDTTFLRSFRGNGVMLNKELSNVEIATLIFLTDFVCYKDCVLRKNGDARGHELDIHELAELKGENYETFRKIIYSLKRKSVLGFHSTGDGKESKKLITFNPFIFCRGNSVSSWVYDFFSDSKWAKITRQSTRN